MKKNDYVGRSDYILKSIFTLMGKRKVVLVIYYGNKTNSNKMDLFVVLDNDCQYNCMDWKDLDITYIGFKHLHEMIDHLDPILTEPLLTGEIIYSTILTGFDKSILDDVDFAPVAPYLRQKALKFLNWAQTHYSNNNCKSAAESARFALGFYYFSNYYKVNNQITTFAELMKELDCPVLKSLTAVAKEEIMLPYAQVGKLLAEVHNLLTNF